MPPLWSSGVEEPSLAGAEGEEGQEEGSGGISPLLAPLREEWTTRGFSQARTWEHRNRDGSWGDPSWNHKWFNSDYRAQPVLVLLCLGAAPSGAQGLILTVHSRITPGGAQGAIWGSETRTQDQLYKAVCVHSKHLIPYPISLVSVISFIWYCFGATLDSAQVGSSWLCAQQAVLSRLRGPYVWDTRDQTRVYFVLFCLWPLERRHGGLQLCLHVTSTILQD